ncbi:MAG: metallophosphoesterase [Gemmatimonadaceae bacterium]|nr:metallophosphoesterase [Gemmatimonadaceae bacterium]
MTTVRVLHLSDIHCGRSFVSAHMEAALDVATTERWNAIVVSGDLSQRARIREFVAARALLDRLAVQAPLLVVPGNHDTAWWHAPFGWGTASRLHEHYRQYINQDVEPVLRLPGLTIAGLNSSQGMLPAALTWYPRDWRVKGGLSLDQIHAVREKLAASPADDLRVLAVHHNVVRGRLSNRWGMSRPQITMDALAALDVDVVCSGHDHEERIEQVTRSTGTFIASTANTLSCRMRGRRASSLNVIEADADTVSVTARCYDPAKVVFTAGPMTLSVPRRRHDVAPVRR